VSPPFLRIAAIAVAIGLAAATLVHPLIGIALGMIAIVYAVLALRPEPRAMPPGGPGIAVSTMTGEAISLPCPACGGKFRQHRPAWLFQCDSCRLLASNLVPAFNRGNESLDEDARYDALHDLRHANFETILDVIERCGLPRGARLLDVGCGHGWLLEQAASRGLHPVGIEPDVTIAGIAGTRCSSVLVGVFPDVLDPNDRFDVLTFNDVLEHLPDIRAAIAASKAHLLPRGFLVLNLPLATGIFYRIATFLERIGFTGPLERLWQVNFPSPHLFYFTAPHLVRIAANVGLREVVRTSLPSLDVRGLWRRLRYDKSRSLLSCLLMWPVLAALVPILRVLPNDIGLQVFVSDSL
jgi:SAM-dependent methyltransferase